MEKCKNCRNESLAETGTGYKCTVCNLTYPYHGNKGNRNACKDENERKDAMVTIRARRQDKAKWQSLAAVRGMTLAELITEVMNNEV